MKIFSIVLTAFLALVPMTSRALECNVPGTTIAWATDQCLLQTGETDAQSKRVLLCLSKMDTVRQPCEWNIFYKESYCKVLIAKNLFHGSNKKCVIDPTTIGPTVRVLKIKYAE
jgi:hypothetical protein